MLRKRIIPTLLLKEGRMIKTKQFGKYKDVGDPVKTAKVYDAQGADELIFLDITASQENREPLFNIIGRTADECFMPLTVGGGIRTLDDIRMLLKSGADKICINTSAVEDPGFIFKAADIYGNSTIIVSMDIKKNPKGEFEIFSARGTMATGLDPLDWAKIVEMNNAGEIFVTFIDTEGCMNGMDNTYLNKIVESVNIPVIAHGGIGTLEDIADAFTSGNVSAVAAASLFHFTDQSPIKVHSYLSNKGIPVCLI